MHSANKWSWIRKRRKSSSALKQSVKTPKDQVQQTSGNEIPEELNDLNLIMEWILQRKMGKQKDQDAHLNGCWSEQNCSALTRPTHRHRKHNRTRISRWHGRTNPEGLYGRRPRQTQKETSALPQSARSKKNLSSTEWTNLKWGRMTASHKC